VAGCSPRPRTTARIFVAHLEAGAVSIIDRANRQDPHAHHHPAG
jgi:hypothetical protein